MRRGGGGGQSRPRYRYLSDFAFFRDKVQSMVE